VIIVQWEPTPSIFSTGISASYTKKMIGYQGKSFITKACGAYPRVRAGNGIEEGSHMLSNPVF